MGTWICHLRNAEILLEQIPGLDKESFIIGSLSPDSGYPNEDWTEFNPPKEVTHFMLKDESDANTRDYFFYKAWLAQPILDNRTYSFRLAYFFHLLCDNLWWRLIWKTTRTENDALINEKGFPHFIEQAKSDWYGLDHIYLRNHPDMPAWQIFSEANNPPSYLDFIPLHALHYQLDYIRNYYNHPDPARVLDRPFPYLNEASMAHFVRDCAAASLEIYQTIQANPQTAICESWLELLDPNLYPPFPPPLGDIVT